jgi:hypothetical protein
MSTAASLPLLPAANKQACVSLMHGRFFGGQRLRAALWDGFTNFHGVSWCEAL